MLLSLDSTKSEIVVNQQQLDVTKNDYEMSLSEFYVENDLSNYKTDSYPIIMKYMGTGIENPIDVANQLFEYSQNKGLSFTRLLYGLNLLFVSVNITLPSGENVKLTTTFSILNNTFVVTTTVDGILFNQGNQGVNPAVRVYPSNVFSSCFILSLPKIVVEVLNLNRKTGNKTLANGFLGENFLILTPSARDLSFDGVSRAYVNVNAPGTVDNYKLTPPLAAGNAITFVNSFEMDYYPNIRYMLTCTWLPASIVAIDNKQQIYNILEIFSVSKESDYFIRFPTLKKIACYPSSQLVFALYIEQDGSFIPVEESGLVKWSAAININSKD